MKKDDYGFKKRQLLYKILKNLGKVTENDDLNKFGKLNETYTSLCKDLFGSHTPSGTEGWDWDIARNYLTYVSQYKNFYMHDRIKKEEYDSKVEEYWGKYLKMLEKLKKVYLR